ncbi:hypothetical protein [Mangrovicoccus sp. HB161399]|uniref:hypothetical protein n=1 Tax=Mangrovicoccus sp. HB161399 TaxID=2720392 RepID=UPI001557FBAD|nr:hypothetical protein [Mangrovicoccus sp. HB161399]
MPALPGLLIEYLVNGAVALIWLLPLLRRISGLELVLPDGNAAGAVLMLLPLVYGLGMVVDRLAKLLTGKVPAQTLSLQWLASLRPEHRAHRFDALPVERNPFYRGPAATPEQRSAQMLARARVLGILYGKHGDLAAELTGRRSRDRVARGFAVNFLLAAVLAGLAAPGTGGQAPVAVNAAVLAACFAVAAAVMFFVWAVFDRESYAFELSLGAALLEESETPPDGAQRLTIEMGV